MNNFIYSIRNETVRVYDSPILDKCDVAVIWSMLWAKRDRQIIYEHYRSNNIPVIILEVGALRRNVLWKVSVNSINANGIWPKVVDEDRYNRLGLILKPWRENGSYIVVCSQNPQSGAWMNASMKDYLEQTLQEIRQYSDRKIIVRPHPRAPFGEIQLPKNTSIVRPIRIGNTDDYDLQHTLFSAHAVISYNSNPGILSVLEGIPVFCDQSSLAAEIGNNHLAQIENPEMPDRHEWIKRIAHTEWTIDEIKDGIPWQTIRDYL